jgi:hypothetical protein
MKAFGAAHNAIFVAPTLYAHDFYHDESIVEIGRSHASHAFRLSGFSKQRRIIAIADALYRRMLNHPCLTTRRS